MDEYIRKQDAIEAIDCDITITGRENAETVCRAIASFVDRIKALEPADVVQVVRCKDCKNWQHGTIGIGCYWDVDYPHQENDFCSRGVRKEE